MEEMFSTLWSHLTTAGLRLVYTSLILFAGLKLMNRFCRWLKNNRRFSHLDDSLRSFLNSLVSITLRTLVFVRAISEWYSRRHICDSAGLRRRCRGSCSAGYRVKPCRRRHAFVFQAV